MANVNSRFYWECEECGFENSPHANRRGPESQLKCEQCGYSAPGTVRTEVLKAMKEPKNA